MNPAITNQKISSKESRSVKGSNRFLKVVSTFLVHSFFLQQLSYAAPDLKPVQLDLFEKPKVNFKLPESVASVEDAYKAPSGNQLVYLLQDAHTNESGQINLAKTLDIILRNEKPLHYVFVEAGVGDDSLSFLRPYAALEKRREVALSYIKKGLLHGEEYLDLTSSRDFKLWGVEDLPLYMKAIDAYRYTATERDKFENYLNQIENTIKVLKPRVYNPWLLSFDAAYEKYLKEETPLTDFFEVLTAEAGKRDISLAAYPHLAGLRALKEKETKIDFKKANEEQIRALASLPAADQSELLELAQTAKSPFKLSTQDHKEEKAYYAYLEEKLTGEAPVIASRSAAEAKQSRWINQIAAPRLPAADHARNDVYPELFKYFDYLKTARRIQAEDILKEEKALEESVFAHLARTQDENNLLRASKNLRALRKLFLLTMTPEEFAGYKAESRDFDITHLTGFLNKKIMELKDFYENAAFLEKGFDKIVARAEEFYTITHERDQAFLDNMSSKMSKESETTAVLITGGYHTPHLKSLLKSKNISYISIRPQVFHETNQKKYEKLLLNQPLDPTLVNRTIANAGKLQSPNMQSMARLAEVANMPIVLEAMVGEMGMPLSVLSKGARLAASEQSASESAQLAQESFDRAEKIRTLWTRDIQTQLNMVKFNPGEPEQEKLRSELDGLRAKLRDLGETIPSDGARLAVEELSDSPDQATLANLLSAAEYKETAADAQWYLTNSKKTLAPVVDRLIKLSQERPNDRIVFVDNSAGTGAASEWVLAELERRGVKIPNLEIYLVDVDFPLARGFLYYAKDEVLMPYFRKGLIGKKPRAFILLKDKNSKSYALLSEIEPFIGRKADIVVQMNAVHLLPSTQLAAIMKGTRDLLRPDDGLLAIGSGGLVVPDSQGILIDTLFRQTSHEAEEEVLANRTGVYHDVKPLVTLLRQAAQITDGPPLKTQVKMRYTQAFILAEGNIQQAAVLLKQSEAEVAKALNEFGILDDELVQRAMKVRKSWKAFLPPSPLASDIVAALQAAGFSSVDSNHSTTALDEHDFQGFITGVSGYNQMMYPYLADLDEGARGELLSKAYQKAFLSSDEQKIIWTSIYAGNNGARLSQSHLSNEQRDFLRRKKYIAVVAAPFAGKGTQLTWLEQELNRDYTNPYYKFVRLEMGDYYRGAYYVHTGEIKSDDPNYAEYKELRDLIIGINPNDFVLMKSGDLMKSADQVVNRILSWPKYANAYGILIDGFPRTIDQVDSLKQNKIQINGQPLSIGLTLLMEVPRETLVVRSGYDRGGRVDSDKTDERLRTFERDTAPVIAALRNEPNSLVINADNQFGPNGEALSREDSIEAVRRNEIIPAIEQARTQGARLTAAPRFLQFADHYPVLSPQNVQTIEDPTVYATVNFSQPADSTKVGARAIFNQGGISWAEPMDPIYDGGKTYRFRFHIPNTAGSYRLETTADSSHWVGDNRTIFIQRDFLLGARLAITKSSKGKSHILMIPAKKILTDLSADQLYVLAVEGEKLRAAQFEDEIRNDPTVAAMAKAKGKPLAALKFAQFRAASQSNFKTAYGSTIYYSNITNRSAKKTSHYEIDGFTVDTDQTAADPAFVQKLLAAVEDHLRGRDLIQVDRSVGQDPSDSRHFRLLVDSRYGRLAHELTALHFPAAPGASSVTPDILTIDLPDFDLSQYGLADKKEPYILRIPSRGINLVLGTDYFGEIKKSALTSNGYLAKEAGNLALHAGSKIVQVLDSKTGQIVTKRVIASGLSGTGKTTTLVGTQGLSGDESSTMFQDDFIELRIERDSAGKITGVKVKGLEAGVYYKTERLDPNKEPELFNAAKHPGTILSNVWMNPTKDGLVPDYDNTDITGNGRGVVSRAQITDHPSVDMDGLDIVVWLTRRETIVPAMAKLNPALAAALFLLGESVITSAADPTRAGESVREAGFSPFIVGSVSAEANVLLEIFEALPQIEVVLANTGKVGATYGEGAKPGAKIDVPDSAALFKALFRGNITTRPDPDWGYEVAHEVPNYDISRLDPSAHYTSDEIAALTAKLRAERVQWLQRFPGLNPKIIDAIQNPNAGARMAVQEFAKFARERGFQAEIQGDTVIVTQLVKNESRIDDAYRRISDLEAPSSSFRIVAVEYTEKGSNKRDRVVRDRVVATFKERQGARLSQAPVIRTGFTKPEGQPKDFFTDSYASYSVANLFNQQVAMIPTAVIDAIRAYLAREMAAGRIKSFLVNDFGGTDIDIDVTHQFGELNADVHRLMLKALQEGLKIKKLRALLKEEVDLNDLHALAKAVNPRVNDHSITERGSESIGKAKIIGGSIGAVNIKLWHEFSIPGSTPLQKLGLSKASGFIFVVRKTEDVMNGNPKGKEWRFEISHEHFLVRDASGKEVPRLRPEAGDTVIRHFPSKNQSIPFLAFVGQTNDYVVTAVYPVEGSGLPADEPIASVIYQPVFSMEGKRAPNPTILVRLQSGADAVGGAGSIIEDVNFVPGGPEGKNFVATKPVSLKESRRAPPKGIANIVYYGGQSHISGRMPMETMVDHVGVNPPALEFEQKLAKELAAIMSDHEHDQPYIAPFAAEEDVEVTRHEQNDLFSHAPKESEPDEYLEEVERKVQSGELISATDDKADMGGTWGHTQVPLWMSAVYKATMLEAQERGELTFGNTFGSVDYERLKDDENWGVGDDGHMFMLGDRSQGGFNAHQLSFLAFTRAYLFSSINKMKPYGEGQDFQGAEAKAAKQNPFFYSKFTPRFFELLRQVMPPKYLNMITDIENGKGPVNIVDRIERGWREWEETGKSAQTLSDPFSGNVSQQGIGSARYFFDPKEESTIEVLAGDKMGPSALNRVIREAVFDAVDSGEFANGLVFEIWDAKAFDPKGNIALKDLPPSLADVKLLVFKTDEEKQYVLGVYQSGHLASNLDEAEKTKLAAILKASGYVPAKRILLDAKEDREAIIKYLADSDRFNVKHVWMKKTAGWDIRNPKAYLDRPALASSITRLGILTGGEYVGKDDPVMVGHVKLMQYARKFLEKRPIIIQGDMNGSHWLWAVPTALKYGVATKDSHPIFVMLRYHISKDGKKFEKVDDLTGDKSFNAIRRRAFRFNWFFKKAQLGGQIEPYGTNIRTVEASYELARILRELNRDDSPYLSTPEKIAQARSQGHLWPEVPATYITELYDVVLSGARLSATPIGGDQPIAQKKVKVTLSNHTPSVKVYGGKATVKFGHVNQSKGNATLFLDLPAGIHWYRTEMASQTHDRRAPHEVYDMPVWRRMGESFDLESFVPGQPVIRVTYENIDFANRSVTVVIEQIASGARLATVVSGRQLPSEIGRYVDHAKANAEITKHLNVNIYLDGKLIVQSGVEEYRMTENTIGRILPHLVINDSVRYRLRGGEVPKEFTNGVYITTVTPDNNAGARLTGSSIILESISGENEDQLRQRLQRAVVRSAESGFQNTYYAVEMPELALWPELREEHIQTAANALSQGQPIQVTATLGFDSHAKGYPQGAATINIQPLSTMSVEATEDTQLSRILSDILEEEDRGLEHVTRIIISENHGRTVIAEYTSDNFRDHLTNSIRNGQTMKVDLERAANNGARLGAKRVSDLEALAIQGKPADELKKLGIEWQATDDKKVYRIIKEGVADIKVLDDVVVIFEDHHFRVYRVVDFNGQYANLDQKQSPVKGQKILVPVGYVFHNTPEAKDLTNYDFSYVRHPGFGIYKFEDEYRLVTLFPNQDNSKELLVVTKVGKDKTDPLTFSLGAVNQDHLSKYTTWSATEKGRVFPYDFGTQPGSVKVNAKFGVVTFQVAVLGNLAFSLINGAKIAGARLTTSIPSTPLPLLELSRQKLIIYLSAVPDQTSVAEQIRKAKNIGELEAASEALREALNLKYQRLSGVAESDLSLDEAFREINGPQNGKAGSRLARIENTFVTPSYKVGSRVRPSIRLRVVIEDLESVGISDRRVGLNLFDAAKEQALLRDEFSFPFNTTLQELSHRIQTYVLNHPSSLSKPEELHQAIREIFSNSGARLALVLARKENESISFSNGATLTVKTISSPNVTILVRTGQEKGVEVTRQIEQTVRIGEKIQVTINRITGKKASFAIEAPDDIRILRGELPSHGARLAILLDRLDAFINSPETDIKTAKPLLKSMAKERLKHLKINPVDDNVIGEAETILEIAALVDKLHDLAFEQKRLTDKQFNHGKVAEQAEHLANLLVEKPFLQHVQEEAEQLYRAYGARLATRIFKMAHQLETGIPTEFQLDFGRFRSLIFIIKDESRNSLKEGGEEDKTVIFSTFDLLGNLTGASVSVKINSGTHEIVPGSFRWHTREALNNKLIAPTQEWFESFEGQTFDISNPLLKEGVEFGARLAVVTSSVEPEILASVAAGPRVFRGNPIQTLRRRTREEPPSVRLDKVDSVVSQFRNEIASNPALKAQIRSFVIGILVSHPNVEKSFALSLDRLNPIFDIRSKKDNQVAVLFFGQEVDVIEDVRTATAEWKKSAGSEKQAALQSRGEEFVLTKVFKAVRDLSPVADTAATRGFVEIPLDKISAELKDDHEFEAVLGFLRAWMDSRKGSNFYLKGIDALADTKRKEAAQRAARTLQETDRKGAVETSLPEKVVVAKINFINPSNPQDFTVDDKREIVVHTVDFSAGDIPNLVAALSLADEAASLYSKSYIKYGTIQGPAEREIIEGLEQSPVIQLFRQFTASKSGKIDAKTVHEVLTAKNRDPKIILLFAIQPILRFLDDRLRALQIMQKVAIFA